MAFQKDVFCSIPVAVFHRTFEVGAVMAVEILEDAILIFETAMCTLWGTLLDCGKVSRCTRS